MQVANHNKCGSFETKNGGQNGTSMAFEFGSELRLCPILVEDLEYPGHMLIEVFIFYHPLKENLSKAIALMTTFFSQFLSHIKLQMLCNEHGFFLEIAQVIRNLDLSILKGTIKCHSNSTWAHFIVEVLISSKDILHIHLLDSMNLYHFPSSNRPSCKSTVICYVCAQVPKGFQRMDVFWRLMLLWQRKSQPITTKR